MLAVFRAGIGSAASTTSGVSAARSASVAPRLPLHLPRSRAATAASAAGGGVSASGSVTTHAWCDDRECESWELPLTFLQLLRAPPANVTAAELVLVEQRIAAARGPLGAGVSPSAARGPAGSPAGSERGALRVLSAWRRRHGHGRGRSHSASGGAALGLATGAV
jgi:hypothetical protein